MVFDERHMVSETAVNDYTFQVNLTIRRIRSSDFNIYTCLTENTFGKTNADIRLRGIFLLVCFLVFLYIYVENE
jgi:hypothetical protein